MEYKEDVWQYLGLLKLFGSGLRVLGEHQRVNDAEGVEELEDRLWVEDLGHIDSIQRAKRDFQSTEVHR